jgi:hypothetical protein
LRISILTFVVNVFWQRGGRLGRGEFNHDVHKGHEERGMAKVWARGSDGGSDFALAAQTGLES